MAITPYRAPFYADDEKGTVQDAPSSAAHSVVSSRWLPHVLALGVIGYWLLVKSVLFHRLEYTTDLFTNLELTRSLFEGRPLLWENGYGDHKAFHNFYIAVLFYPFTRFLGAYGLFVAQALLSGWAVHDILRRARDAEEWRRVLYWATLAAMALGPVAFFIWENPVYGFHFELLFVPLSALFALSLSRRSRSAWIYGALIVLIREEGALLAWCIQVLYEVLNAQAGDRKARSALFRRLAWITLGWLVVFIAGMGLLLAMGAGSHGRLGSAPSAILRLINDSAIRSLFFRSLIDAALLLAAGAVVYLAGIPRRGLVITALISLVLIPPITVASSVYFESLREHGIVWPPRLAMLWGVALAGCLLAIERARPPIFADSRGRRAWVAIAVAASIGTQFAVLAACRRYDFISRFTLNALSIPRVLVARFVPASDFARYYDRPRYVAWALSSAEDAFLGCLGRDLPHDTSVTATGTLFGRFHRQDLVFSDRVANAWKPPELVVCDDAGRFPLLEFGCMKLARSLPDTSYEMLALGNLAVRYSGRPKGVVEACAARLAPAVSPAQ